MNSIETKEGSFSGTSESDNLAKNVDQIVKQVVDIPNRDFVNKMDRFLDDIGQVVKMCANVEEACEQIICLSHKLKRLLDASSDLDSKIRMRLAPIILEIITVAQREVSQSLDD